MYRRPASLSPFFVLLFLFVIPQGSAVVLALPLFVLLFVIP
jgi:hypothetical protein